jgi:hypothetical protein
VWFWCRVLLCNRDIALAFFHLLADDSREETESQSERLGTGRRSDAESVMGRC